MVKYVVELSDEEKIEYLMKENVRLVKELANAEVSLDRLNNYHRAKQIEREGKKKQMEEVNKQLMLKKYRWAIKNEDWLHTNEKLDEEIETYKQKLGLI